MEISELSSKETFLALALFCSGAVVGTLETFQYRGLSSVITVGALYLVFGLQDELSIAYRSKVRRYTFFLGLFAIGSLAGIFGGSVFLGAS